MNLISFLFLALLGGHQGPVDFAGYRPACGVDVRQSGTTLQVRWPIDDRSFGILVFELRQDQPLIEELGIATTAKGPSTPLLRKVHPATFLTVGSRDLSAQGWNVFFDNPPRRPHETFRAVLQETKVRIESRGRRAAIVFAGLAAGPFDGEMRFTVYPGCPLVHAEAILATTKDACAILYDAGLTSPEPSWTTVSWLDNHDRWRRSAARSQETVVPLAVRHRTIVAESRGGSVAVFPPPHQYLYPLDFADNFGFAWHGDRMVRGVGWGFGVRQPPEGDRRFVPWINAPPGTQQHLGVFYLLTPAKAEQALEQVKRFTHGDTFKKLDGYRTFTSHYHIEHTLDFVRRQQEQKTDAIPRGLAEPGFVKTFKEKGVDIAHLAEFHVNHTQEMNANRLSLLKTLHSECRRLSNDEFLLLPGEEPNVYLGGHWISLFARPVYWLLHPPADAPFERQVPGVGTVYAVRNAGDVLRLMKKEHGLMWTAHPRTKSSYGYPDRYRKTEFYLSDRFLGAAWKAMPADLSKPRLGTRVLDLMDDMANWGQKKYVLGEVDVFRVEPDYELYGHMNINYLKLNKLPRFDDGWQPVLDALRNGQFFVTTGEVLIHSFSVGRKESGQTLALGESKTAELRAKLEWTFPPAFAEIIWGDGSQVYRQRIDLADEPAFSRKQLQMPVDLKDAKWVRLEVWDIAGNGAFTQPVWIE
jgi:hypothetical protein